MKAIRVAKTGGPEALELQDVGTPDPQAGEVLVRIAAAGVNFIDIYQRSGAYKVPLPFTPGQEGAGVVESVGRGVASIKPGARVAWAGVLGSYASHQAIAADRLVTLPAGVEEQTAAAAMLQGMTAHYLVNDTFRLKPGDSCVIHAAAGGVGQLFCQLARRAGAHVIGTAGGPDKVQLALAAGAHECIDYKAQDFEAEVKRLTGGKGVHVVYDSVGKDTFDRSLRCLRARGTLVLFGASSGPVPPIDLQVLAQNGSLYVTRPTLGHYQLTREELVARASSVLRSIEIGELKIRIEKRLPLGEASLAHELLASRQTSGKLLLVP